jgi:hypothetical protein
MGAERRDASLHCSPTALGRIPRRPLRREIIRPSVDDQAAGLRARLSKEILW